MADLYAELLSQQSDNVRSIHNHINQQLSLMENKKDLCNAKRLLLNTFRKDVQDSFHECRTQLHSAFTAIREYLKNSQDAMLEELEQTLNHNMKELQRNGVIVDSSTQRIEAMIEEGKALLREQDMFTFFAKGTLFQKLKRPDLPRIDCNFKDTFPDLTSLTLTPYQIPLRHSVAIDIAAFLHGGVPSRICGNIFHNGFRFQLQLKFDDRYLSAYLCLRAWHDVSAFLRVTVNFTLTLTDGPALLHSATARNTFEGQNDGWGWNKFISLSKLQDCTEVLFQITFHELTYHFLAEMEAENGDSQGHLHAPPSPKHLGY